MKQFTMSKYATKEAMYKAKAEYLERQLRWLAEQRWFKVSAHFWLKIEEEFSDHYYFDAVTGEIDKRMEQKGGKSD